MKAEEVRVTLAVTPLGRLLVERFLLAKGSSSLPVLIPSASEFSSSITPALSEAQLRLPPVLVALQGR